MDLTTTLRALSDPTRRNILDLLRAGDVAAGDLAERLAMSRPAVSKHLAVLREAGLAVPQRRGRQQIYHLEAGTLEELREWLGRHPPAPSAAARPARDAAAAPAPAPDDRRDDWKCW